MSFMHLTTGLALTGVATLGALLFVLSRLRVRHRPVEVVTTLFWREAIEHARARVLFERFRHPLAYLLVLAVAALLWFAFAGPKIDSHDADEYVVFIDGSAAMATGGLFAETRDAVIERVKTMPRDHRRVIFCGGQPRTVLLPGENERLLGLRLAHLDPEACPATVSDAMAGAVASLSTAKRIYLLVAGRAPIERERIARLDGRIDVARLATERDDGSATKDALVGNRGITAVGVTPASSGDYERVDLFVEISTVGSEPGAPPAIAKGATALEVAFEASAPVIENGAVRARWCARDLRADGGLLTVRATTSDALAIDDVARLRLPSRRRIRVALAAALEPLLLPVLTHDPAIQLTTTGADVAIVDGDADGTTTALPTLAFVSNATDGDAFLLEHETALSSQRVVDEGFASLGLDRIDAMDLAQATSRVIRLGARPSSDDRRRLRVWRELLEPRFNFVESRSFPLFIASAVRWLAHEEEFDRVVAVGRAVDNFTGPFHSVNGAPRDATMQTFGDAWRPAVAGDFSDANGTAFSAALIDPVTTLGPARVTATAEHSADIDADDTPTFTASATRPPWRWLLFVALALFAIEWFLFRSGRIP